jgi:DNA polymerase-4
MIGKNGQELWKKANGIDETPVVPFHERKSISKEHTFTNDTMDLPMLKSIISGMAEQLAYQLRKEKWLTSTVVIKIRYANFDTETKQSRVAYTAVDHTLSRVALDLFEKVYTRRMRLRLIGLRFTNLVHGQHQMNLFEDTEELMNLYQAMDRMKNRFGSDALGRASGFFKV